MPAINLEMMKQLLQEFTEKEALTTAEIGVIENEIIALEERKKVCQTKLSYLSEDKQRLATITARYGHTNPIAVKSAPPISQVNQINQDSVYQNPTEVSEVPARPEFPAQANIPPLPEPAPVPYTEPAPAFSSFTETYTEVKATELSTPVTTQAETKSEPSAEQGFSGVTENISQPIAKPEQQKTNVPDELMDLDAEDQTDGDTIKSINDALKGLFRK